MKTTTRPHAEDTLIYRAAIALPDDDGVTATGRLQGQLTIMAAAADAIPDWTTLAVMGPTEMPGADARTRFEWTASVAFLGGIVLDALPDPDWLPASPTVVDTVPLVPACAGDSRRSAAAVAAGRTGRRVVRKTRTDLRAWVQRQHLLQGGSGVGRTV